MLGKITAIQQDHKAIFIELETTASFKMGQVVEVTKAKKHRSIQQNRLYWAFLTWCIHPKGGALCDQGHFSTDALHANVKAWIESTHAHDFAFDKNFSTADLTTKQFNDFLELVSHELFGEILGIDTSGFELARGQYDKYGEYRSGSFKDFMDEQYNDLP
jgi:hypothetical protein